MADAEIRVKVTTDTSQAQTGLDQAAAKAESFGGRFKSVFAGVLAANVVQNLAAKVFDFGKQSVDAYEQAEATSIKFTDALSRIPGASKATTDALTAQAKALSQVTIYSAGQSKQAIATLASYGLTGQQLEQLLPLVQDYATKTGQDLPTAASAVGKALLGQGRALKGVGIDFTNTKTLAGNFQEVVGGLSDKVGGLAVQMGETSAGKMKIMENNVTALKVALGSALVPAIEQTLKILQPFMTFVQNNTRWLVPLAMGIIAVATAFKVLNAAFALLGMNPTALLVLAIAAAVVLLAVAIYELWTHWSTVWGWIMDIVHAVWNWIVQNWPLLLPILFGPVGIAAALIIKYWSDIWNAAVAVWSWLAGAWNAVYGFIVAPIVAAAQWVWGAIVNIGSWFAGLPGRIAAVFSAAYNAVVSPIAQAADWVWGKVQMIGGWFAGIPGAIAGALSGVFNAIISPFRDAWNWINDHILGPLKSAWNGVAHAINSFHIHIPGVSIFGHQIIPDIDWSPPFHVPTLAQGGLLTRTGLVYAHAGEVISPAPASARGRNGPVVEIQHAHFSERVDVTAFGKRLAWQMRTAGV